MKIRKTLSKKVNVFGKGIPVFAIVILGLAVVSAALIPYWGVITGFVTVSQGLTVDGLPWNTLMEYSESLTSLEEKTVSSGEHTLANGATVDATVTLNNVCTDTGSNGCLEPTLVTTTEYLLLVSGTAGTEERIHIRASDVGVTTLNDLTSMSWEVYTALGYPPHVDIILGDDIDGNAGNIDSITAEMAVDQSMGIVAIAGSLPNAWVKTFELTSGDGHDAISDSTRFWITRLGAGTADAPSGTLGELKVGTISNNPDAGDPPITIGSGTKVLAFEIEVDNWVEDSTSDVRNILISGNSADKITVLAGDHLDFEIATDFPKMMMPDTYTITTTVDAL